MVFVLPSICLTMLQKFTYKEAAVPFTPTCRINQLSAERICTSKLWITLGALCPQHQQLQHTLSVLILQLHCFTLWKCQMMQQKAGDPRLHVDNQENLHVDNPTWERCLDEDESAIRILCDCKAIAYLKFHYLGQFLMEPSDYYDVPINKVLHFIQSVGLTKS
jgi:hypothetical protein